MKFSIQTFIWLFVIVALVVVAGVALMPQPVEVQTATAAIGDLQLTVQEDGKTRIREKYVVSTPVAGRLSRVELKAGDEVCEEGSLIAVILPGEPTMLDARAKAQAEARFEQAKAAVKRAEAAMEQTQVNFDRQKKKYERAKKLIQNKAIAQSEFDDTYASFRSASESIRTGKFDEEIAHYEMKMAEAALVQFSEDAKEATKPFEVAAPVCGKVLRVFQESATVVNVGTPLIEMGDPGNLEIEIDVLSEDAVKVQPGSKLIIEHWGGQEPLTGTVRVIEPAAFTKISSLGVEEQRVNVIADFDEPKERLAALGDGYRVEARITIEKRSGVLQIPNSALFRHQKKWHVFRVDQDKAKMVPVVIGLQNETHTQVLEGLEKEDEVVLYPSDSIQSNTKIVRLQEK